MSYLFQVWLIQSLVIYSGLKRHNVFRQKNSAKFTWIKNKNYLKRIVNIVFKTIRFRPYQVRHGNIQFTLSLTRLFETLETFKHLYSWRHSNHLGTWKALKTLAYLKDTWGIWAHERHLGIWRTLQTQKALGHLRHVDT